MNSVNEMYAYRPTITFQDTNVVGNVYFLTFFRWQAECQDRWLRDTRPDLWRELRYERRPLIVVHWSNDFGDSSGATIGDEVSVSLSKAVDTAELISTTFEVARRGADRAARLATGTLRFATSARLPSAESEPPIGRCYSHEVVLPCGQSWTALDLLGWQGKCREAFLSEHAPETLRSVAQRRLILQTSSASFDLICLPPPTVDDFRVEMRLEMFKNGRMEVRFDYFAQSVGEHAVRFATGRQKMCSKHATGASIDVSCFPKDLSAALARFTDRSELLSRIQDVVDYWSAAADRDAKQIDH